MKPCERCGAEVRIIGRWCRTCRDRHQRKQYKPDKRNISRPLPQEYADALFDLLIQVDEMKRAHAKIN